MKRKLACAAIALAFLPTMGQAQTYNCDVNGDGTVNVADVMLVVDKVLGTSNDSQRRIKFYVTEEPFETESGGTRKSIRRAPEVTTSTLKQFYLHLLYGEEGFLELSDDHHTYITKEGHYQTEATWPGNLPLNTPVSFFAYHNNQESCLLDEANKPYLLVELEENSSEQTDVLVAKEAKSWNECEGVINLKFHHACAAAQFSIKKSEKMAEKGYNVEVNQVVLHNIIKTGDYMLDDFTWKIPEAAPETVTNFTLNAYRNGEKTDFISLTTDATLLAKDENDFLFLLPTKIESVNRKYSEATAADGAYIEIKCKVYKDNDYKVGSLDEFGSVYLPFGYDLSGYKGKIKSFVINFGTSIRDFDGYLIIQ